MGRKYLAVLLIIISIATASAGCSGPATPTAPPASASSPEKGVSLSPRTYDQPGFEDFFTLSGQAGNTVTWAGDWDQLGVPGQGPEYVTATASKYGVTPVLILTYYSQSEGRLLRPLDAATRARYLEEISAYAEKHKPDYLGVGLEVNVMAEKSPAEFEEFVQLYGDTYDAVKAVSPETKVFTVFQLERMKGLQGGLFGGPDEPGATQWQLLERFSQSDLYAFTTYPGLIYRDPSELSPDYYTDILAHTGKPVAFTEIGWYSGAPAPGWESSEDAQARFVGTFFSLTADVKPDLRIWSFLYDQNAAQPFTTMGLRRADGEAKPAWGEWIRARS